MRLLTAPPAKLSVLAAKSQLLKASQLVKLELGMVLFQAGGEPQWYGVNFNGIALARRPGYLVIVTLHGYISATKRIEWL